MNFLGRKEFLFIVTVMNRKYLQEVIQDIKFLGKKEFLFVLMVGN